MHADKRDSDRDSNFPALSIKQPWAQLIIEGKKDVEIRRWASTYRGPLWIHTGQKIDETANAHFQRDHLTTGAVLGWVYLFGIRPFCSRSFEAWRDRHLDNAMFDEQVCKYGWVFKDITPLDKPVVAPGRLQLFHFDADVLSQLEQARS